MDPVDPDAPMLLVYAPVSWLERRDQYGDIRDDDSNSDLVFGDVPDDADDTGRWCRAEALDCADGLPDNADYSADNITDWLPF